MSKLLFLLTQGGGNVIQTIPTYLALKEHHEIDVVYMPIYPTDSVAKCAVFPADVEAKTPEEVRNMRKNYDYQINFPSGFLVNNDGSYVREVLDELNENDSEVHRNLQVCKFLGVEPKIQKEYRHNEHKERYIVVHNGGLNIPAWNKKKYPMFKRLVSLMKELDLPIVSIGAPMEYVEGTMDFTGLPLKDTAGLIKNAHLWVGTDCLTMHLASLVDTPGVGIFTCTSETKNTDKDFHDKLTTVRNNVACSPGQWGYHWHPLCGVCGNARGNGFAPCQNVSPQAIMDAIKKKL